MSTEQDLIYDGYAVYQGMTDQAKARTSTDNVSDVLDSLHTLTKAARQQAVPSVCACDGLCEQRGLASDEVSKDCKAVYPQSDLRARTAAFVAELGEKYDRPQGYAELASAMLAAAPQAEQVVDKNPEHSLFNEIRISTPVNEDDEETRYLINEAQLQRIRMLESQLAAPPTPDVSQYEKSANHMAGKIAELQNNIESLQEKNIELMNFVAGLVHSPSVSVSTAQRAMAIVRAHKQEGK